MQRRFLNMELTKTKEQMQKWFLNIKQTKSKDLNKLQAGL
jgi:hypothetical protein